jgi:hypothetical protein
MKETDRISASSDQPADLFLASFNNGGAIIELCVKKWRTQINARSCTFLFSDLINLGINRLIITEFSLFNLYRNVKQKPASLIRI